METNATHIVIGLMLVLIGGCGDQNSESETAAAPGDVPELEKQLAAFSDPEQATEQSVTMVRLDLPSPQELRGGWAALAAVLASRGWTDGAYAEGDQWYYHDGGGNWVCIRFQNSSRAVMIGHDHEYSETYFREAASYFDEEETDLLAGVPEWWSLSLEPSPSGGWIGFIYGWDGRVWQRAAYAEPDGFDEIGLTQACSISDTTKLADLAADAPGLNGQAPSDAALAALVAADGDITAELLEEVVPGWDIQAGVAAGRKFLDIGFH